LGTGLFPAGDLGVMIGRATWVQISRAFHDRPARFFAIPEIKHPIPPHFVPHCKAFEKKDNTILSHFPWENREVSCMLG
jgi:hypothetical protein